MGGRALVAPASAQGHPFRFAREDVLGTSAELMVDASDEATAQRAEAIVDRHHHDALFETIALQGFESVHLFFAGSRPNALPLSRRRLFRTVWHAGFASAPLRSACRQRTGRAGAT